MDEKYLTDFSEDPETFQLIFSRRFLAPIELVWQFWTDHSFIDKWWAPAPLSSKTVSQIFEIEGHWHYRKDGPENKIDHFRMVYDRIEEPFFYSGLKSLCDEEGNVEEEAGSRLWELYFSGEENGTRVKVMVTFSDMEEMEQMKAAGFQEGFAMANKTLDLILAEHIEAMANSEEE